MNTFDQSNFHTICDELASKDADLKMVIDTYGYPPMWSRPNTFETLVHIILEQQVSLASALSALNKLRDRVQEITPARVLLLTDEELKACYFSRQKTIYVRYLAEAMLTGEINLKHIAAMPDDAVRNCLTTLKGIGNWTVDVYLMFVLQRADIFPAGDLAAVNALKRVKQLPPEAVKEAVMLIAEQWKPHRTVATMMLWHWYLSCPKKVK
ncbi:DNA-3-methyladenine glycosylase 2 family protein [Mucilaginibacter sp. UR6-1]|uniref:DNA-3-methyladenine glycosylase family protein n=1 Tax=Mucilaginibacter sp. UR6-1 TaxID=1435643 RepID=UPI001E4B4DD6|nr:DNA-3-methyladenine glycosylase 2 family protein [Mucilaginibacter sp. UR6-1]MCC8410340.1 DNA-3-methyladenine glycosylase 2 family protein [Mucilaginibacter sp. UR6-1]